MVSLRTEEAKNKYKEYIRNGGLNNACVLCEKPPVKSFNFWKVIENDFPYDLIASKHHMLVPLRHIPEEGLNEDEIKEVKQIKEDLINSDYDWTIEATRKNKSIPDHFHLHLIVGKP
jgi:hypothetical protein